MASRENPKTNGKIAGELKLLGEESSENSVLASLPWNQPPLCWLTPEQQSRLQQVSETLRYNLGEKIWSQEAEVSSS
jgi:ATP-binding cassette subfamily B protein